jgi:hypothetical protein
MGRSKLSKSSSFLKLRSTARGGSQGWAHISRMLHFSGLTLQLNVPNFKLQGNCHSTIFLPCGATKD